MLDWYKIYIMYMHVIQLSKSHYNIYTEGVARKKYHLENFLHTPDQGWALLIAWTSGNMFLQIFVTLLDAQNRPNKWTHMENGGQYTVNLKSLHSHKILTKQQSKPCYLGIWCNPCSDQESCQAGIASLFPELNRVDSYRGFPMELIPRG